MNNEPKLLAAVRKDKRQNKIFSVTFLLCIILFAVSVPVFCWRIYEIKRETSVLRDMLKNYESSADKNNKKIAELKKEYRKLARGMDFVLSDTPTLKTLAYLSSLNTGNIAVTGITLDKSVVIEGYCADNIALSSFISNFKDKDVFKNVSVLETKNLEDRLNFKVMCTVNGEIEATMEDKR